MGRKEVCQNSWNRRTDRKLYFQTTRWNLGKHVKIYHGMTVLQHLIDPRQMASLKEPFDQSKKVLQQYCHSQDWMKGGGPTLWNAIAICEMSKTSWPIGNLLMKDGSANRLKAQWFLLEQWLKIIRFHRKIKQEFINLARKYYQNLSWLWAGRGWI